MVKSLSSILLFFGILGFAHAAEQCPAINCDCDSLSNENWVSVCKNHEARIKKECVANSNTPKDYCSIHGLNAKPLPLAIEFSEFQLDESTDVDALNEKIASLYWAIYADTESAIKAFDKASYAKTLQILKLIDSNIDNLFEHQQKVEATYVARQSEKKSKGAWKKYSTDSMKFAKSLEDLGTQIATKIESAASAKDKKIFSVLSQKSLRMAGKGYEHTGHAFGKSGRHNKAAEAWKLAANAALQVTDINKSVGAKESSIKFAEFQAAARLHRASYHWMMINNLDESNDGLRQSQLYVNREEQKTLEGLFDDSQDNSGDGVLTER